MKKPPDTILAISADYQQFIESLKSRICAEKDDVEVEYALRTKANPIVVAAYALQSKLPGELKGKLPTAKQLSDILRVEMEGGE